MTDSPSAGWRSVYRWADVPIPYRYDRPTTDDTDDGERDLELAQK
jgi:hypothetical protein